MKFTSLLLSSISFGYVSAQGGKVVTFPLEHVYTTFYRGLFKIGTPSQEITARISINSPDISLCSGEGCLVDRYNATQSNSFEQTREPSSDPSDMGSGTDDFRIGKLLLKDLEFQMIKSPSSEALYHNVGLNPFAEPKEGSSNLFREMIDRKLLRGNILSLDFYRYSFDSTLTFGKSFNKLASTPLVLKKGKECWSFNVETYQIEDRPSVSIDDSVSIDVEGSSHLPKSVAEKIYSSIPGEAQPNSEGRIIDCNDILKLPKIYLTPKNSQLPIAIDNSWFIYLWPAEDKRRCVLTINTSDDDTFQWKLGANFFYEYLVSLNYDEMSIGYAKKP